MPTTLENYWGIRRQIEDDMGRAPATAEQILLHTELVYRISVLDTFQMFCRSASTITALPAMMSHYKLMDSFVESLTRDRRYGPSRGPDTENERQAADTSFTRVVADYRQRFSSFVPDPPEAYAQEIGKVVNAIIPAWLQSRNTFVPLTKGRR